MSGALTENWGIPLGAKRLWSELLALRSIASSTICRAGTLPGSRRYQPPNRRLIACRQIIPAAADFDQCSLCMIRRSQGDDVNE
jgi:hypothetical protein